MKKTALLLMAIMLGSLLFSCAGTGNGSSSTTEPDPPAWWTTLPQDPNTVFGKGVSTGRAMAAAVTDATVMAQADMSSKIEAKISDLRKRFFETVGHGYEQKVLNSFGQATKTFTEQRTGFSEYDSEEQHWMKNGKTVFRYYVVIETPTGASASEVLNDIKKEDEMYTRYRESEIMKELEAESKEYQASQKE